MGHKCFISFKTEDAAFKQHIQVALCIDMIDKSLDEAINSEDEDYIMQTIRADYLSDSTVTIHLIGARSAESLGAYEQRFIKRELQASLFNGEDNPRSGILGVVLPAAEASIFKGSYMCTHCGGSHAFIAIDDQTVIREFSANYYIPNNKCCHTEDERYCVLVRWDEFCQDPDRCIEEAFVKRSQPIANKVKVRP